jgi:catechol 2,3-dioxygenase-like lactoylglutathione lyase family enzyme
VDVLSSRILLRPGDLDRSRRFYRDLLGLAIYREFGPPDDPGVVFFLGQALLEISGRAADPPGRSVMIWIQVRDVQAEHARLAAAGVPIIREPAAEPWGLTEMWIEDPDGLRIVLVEVPADHPLRRDPRSALAPTLRTLMSLPRDGPLRRLPDPLPRPRPLWLPLVKPLTGADAPAG